MSRDYDKELVAMAQYVMHHTINSNLAYETAYYCFLDSIGCAALALQYPECKKLLGPVVPGTIVPKGSRVLGTDFILDPIQAAFNIGALIRWLDFNDTWLAQEWGHPSDNLGGILAVADYLNQQGKVITLRDVFTAMIKAYEIQGVLALENSFNRVGLDHVVLVKVATAAVVMQMLGGSEEQILAVLSQAWIDGQSLRTYRHAPNTGSRKSWAAGDATARGVRLAWMTLQGERGYSSALTAKTWGFYDASFKGEAFKFSRIYDSYVIENVLFKVAFPAEFHAQTAIEAALKLYPQVNHRLQDIEKIVLTTHLSAMRIINKVGPLHNPADRDHCLQYMVAIGLIFGELTAQHYEEIVACDVRIDELRNKMQVIEDERFSRDYLDPEKRSIANAIEIYFKDGTKTEKITIEYPLGHKKRRAEGIPLLIEKLQRNLAATYSPDQVKKISAILLARETLEKIPVAQLMDVLVEI